MLKKYVQTLLFFKIFACLCQQNEFIRCGTNNYILKEKNKYENLFQNIEQQSVKPLLRVESGPIVIPVVVHVLYNSTSTNISDEQILSQIDALNRDFRAQNTDLNEVPDVFKSLIADIGIEFCLAKRDPFGNPTNGITRTYTNKSFFTVVNDDAKFDSTGGKNIWNRDKYLNIWVVPSLRNTENSNVTTLGYAEYPGSQENIDGIVIVHRAFGTTGTAQSPFHLGRTTTHEIGHWLGLFHTFEFGCAGTNPSTCNSAGDLICDTPPASGPTYGCPTNFKNTCVETPTDYIDMTMNYLDYVNDNCMYFFTNEQKNRMLFFLNTARQSLLTSDACFPPVVSNLNLSLIEIREINPSCSSTKTFKINVKNNGIQNINSVELSFYQNDEWIANQSFSTNLAFGDTTSFTISVNLNKSGTVNFKAIINKVNNQKDDKAIDDIGIAQVYNPEIVQLPFSEDFETITSFNKWEIKNNDNRYTWERINLTGINGNYSVYMNNFDYDHGNGQKDDLISPAFNLSDCDNCTFNYAYRLYTPLTEEELFSDTLAILVQENCIRAPVEIARWSALDLTTGTPYFQNTPYYPTLSDWGTKRLDLKSFKNKTIQLIFRNICDHENNLFIDNISINCIQSSKHIQNTFNENNIYVINKTIYWNTTFQPTSIEILDLTGKLLLKKETDSNHRIELNELPHGLYLAKLIGENNFFLKKIFLFK